MDKRQTVLKQHNIKFIGAFINVLYLTMPLFGMLAYSMSALTLYTVNIDFIHNYLNWLSLPVFVFSVAVFCSVVMFLNYKFLYPSYYEFLNKQTYKHNNPMQMDLELIKKKLGIEDK